MTQINKDRDSVARNIIQKFADRLRLPAEEVPEEHKLQDDLGADEVDILTVAMAIDQDYGIQLDTNALDQVVTIRDLVELTMATIGS